jgi:hypothetical protein
MMKLENCLPVTEGRLIGMLKRLLQYHEDLGLQPWLALTVIDQTGLALCTFPPSEHGSIALS